MIALKQESASAPPQKLQGGLPVNIFAGLSFPEVPTHAINPPAYTATSKEECIKQEYNADNYLANEIEQERTQPVEEVSAGSNCVTHAAQSLASLYSTNETETAGIYPELPVSIVSMRYNNTQGYSYPEVGEVSSAELSASLYETVEVESSCPTDERKGIEPCLVTDLMSENARLSAELDQLKKSLVEKFPSTQTTTGVATAASSSSGTIIGAQQEGMMRGERDEENHGLLQASPNLSKNGIKYVCCGSCRIWLSAPIGSVFVKCPGCEAVNNCEQQSRPQSDQTLTGNNWFSSCFNNMFSSS